jgi:LPXTG-motif cell wall-anchored protein
VVRVTFPQQPNAVGVAGPAPVSRLPWLYAGIGALVLLGLLLFALLRRRRREDEPVDV